MKFVTIYLAAASVLCFMTLPVQAGRKKHAPPPAPLCASSPKSFYCFEAPCVGLNVSYTGKIRETGAVEVNFAVLNGACGFTTANVSCGYGAEVQIASTGIRVCGDITSCLLNTQVDGVPVISAAGGAIARCASSSVRKSSAANAACGGGLVKKKLPMTAGANCVNFGCGNVGFGNVSVSGKAAVTVGVLNDSSSYVMRTSDAALCPAFLFGLNQDVDLNMTGNHIVTGRGLMGNGVITFAPEGVRWCSDTCSARGSVNTNVVSVGAITMTSNSSDPLTVDFQNTLWSAKCKNGKFFKNTNVTDPIV